MGDFSVYVLSDPGGVADYSIRWSLSGQQSTSGTDWKQAQIGLAESTVYQVCRYKYKYKFWGHSNDKGVSSLSKKSHKKGLVSQQYNPKISKLV